MRSLKIILSLGLSAVLLFIVTLIRFYFYKHKNYTKQNALKSGYGFYSDSKSAGCIAPSNDCTVPGTETIIQKCIPNPNTGRGCLDENGNETYQTKYKIRSCNNQCISNSFSKSDGVTVGDPKDTTRRLQPILGSGCNRVVDPNFGVDYTGLYIGDYNTDTRNYHLKMCIPDYFTGYYQKKLTCISKDGVGMNNCNYECGSDQGVLRIEGLLNSTTSSELIQYYPLEDNYGGGTKRTCYDLNEVDQIEILNYGVSIPKDFVYPDICYKHSPVHNLQDDVWPNLNSINTVLMQKKFFTHDSEYIELESDDVKKIFTNVDKLVDPEYWLQNDYNSYVKVLLDEEMTLLDRSIKSPSFPSGDGEIVIEPNVVKDDEQISQGGSVLDGIMYLKVSPIVEPEDETIESILGRTESINFEGIFDSGNPFSSVSCESYYGYPETPAIKASGSSTYYLPVNMKPLFNSRFYNIKFTYYDNQVVTCHLSQVSLNDEIIVYLNFDGLELSGFFKGTVTELDSSSDVTTVTLSSISDNYLNVPELEDNVYTSESGFYYTLPLQFDTSMDFVSMSFVEDNFNKFLGKVDFNDSFVTDTVFMQQFYNQDPKTFRSSDFGNQPLDYMDIKFSQTKVANESIENFYVYGTLGGQDEDLARQFWYPLKLDPSGTVRFEEYGDDYTFSFSGVSQSQSYELPPNTDLKDFSFYSGIARTKYQTKRLRDKTPVPDSTESDYYFITSLETVTRGVGYTSSQRYPILHGGTNLRDGSISYVYQRDDSPQGDKHILKLIRSSSSYFISLITANPQDLSHKSNKILEYFRMIQNQKQPEIYGDENIRVVIHPQKTLTQIADYRVFKSPYLIDTKGNYTFPCYNDQGVPKQRGTVINLTEGDTVFINKRCTNYNTDKNSKCGVLGVSTSSTGTSVIEVIQPRITQNTYFSEDCIPQPMDNYTTVNSVFEQGVLKKKLLRAEKYGTEEKKDQMVDQKFFAREYDPEKIYASGEEFFVNKHQVNYYVSLKDENKDFIDKIDSWKRIYPFQNLTRTIVYQDFFHSNTPLTQENNFYTLGTTTSPYYEKKISDSDEVLANFSIQKSGLATKSFASTAISYHTDHFRFTASDGDGNTNMEHNTESLSNSLFRRPISSYYKLYQNSTDSSSTDQFGEWTYSGLTPNYKISFKINNDYSSSSGATFRARLFDQDLSTPFSDVAVGDKIHFEFDIFYNLFSCLEFTDPEVFDGLPTEEFTGSKDYLFNKFFPTIIKKEVYEDASEQSRAAFLNSVSARMYQESELGNTMTIPRNDIDKIPLVGDIIVIVPSLNISSNSYAFNTDRTSQEVSDYFRKIYLSDVATDPGEIVELTSRLESGRPFGLELSECLKTEIGKYDDGSEYVRLTLRRNITSIPRSRLPFFGNFEIQNSNILPDIGGEVRGNFPSILQRIVPGSTLNFQLINLGQSLGESIMDLNYTIKNLGTIGDSEDHPVRFVEFDFNIPSVSSSDLSVFYQDNSWTDSYPPISNSYTFLYYRPSTSSQTTVIPNYPVKYSSIKYIKNVSKPATYKMTGSELNATICKNDDKHNMDTKLMSYGITLREVTENSQQFYYVSEFRENYGINKKQTELTFSVGDVIEYYYYIPTENTISEKNGIGGETVETKVVSKSYVKGPTLKVINVNYKKDIEQFSGIFQIYDYRCQKVGTEDVTEPNLVGDYQTRWSNYVSLFEENVDPMPIWRQYKSVYYNNLGEFTPSAIVGFNLTGDVRLITGIVANTGPIDILSAFNVTPSSDSDIMYDYYPMAGIKGVTEISPQFDESNFVFSSDSIRAGEMDVIKLSSTTLKSKNGERITISDIDVVGKPHGSSYFISPPSPEDQIPNWNSFGRITSFDLEDEPGNPTFDLGTTYESEKGFQVLVSKESPASYLYGGVINSRSRIRQLKYANQVQGTTSISAYSKNQVVSYLDIYKKQFVRNIGPSSRYDQNDLEDKDFRIVPQLLSPQDQFVTFKNGINQVVNKFIKLELKDRPPLIYKENRNISDMPGEMKNLGSMGLVTPVKEMRSHNDKFYMFVTDSDSEDYKDIITSTRNLNLYDLPPAIKKYNDDDGTTLINSIYYPEELDYTGEFTELGYFDDIRYAIENPVLMKKKDTSKYLSLGHAPVSFNNFSSDKYNLKFLGDPGGKEELMAQLVYLVDLENGVDKYNKYRCTGNLKITKPGDPTLDTGVSKFDFSNSLLMQVLPCSLDSQDTLKYDGKDVDLVEVNSGSKVFQTFFTLQTTRLGNTGTNVPMIKLDSSGNYSQTSGIFKSSYIESYTTKVSSKQNFSVGDRITLENSGQTVILEVEKTGYTAMGTINVTNGGSGYQYGDIWMLFKKGGIGKTIGIYSNTTLDSVLCYGFLVPDSNGEINNLSFMQIKEFVQGVTPGDTLVFNFISENGRGATAEFKFFKRAITEFSLEAGTLSTYTDRNFQNATVGLNVRVSFYNSTSRIIQQKEAEFTSLVISEGDTLYLPTVDIRENIKVKMNAIFGSNYLGKLQYNTYSNQVIRNLENENLFPMVFTPYRQDLFLEEKTRRSDLFVYKDQNDTIEGLTDTFILNFKSDRFTLRPNYFSKPINEDTSVMEFYFPGTCMGAVNTESVETLMTTNLGDMIGVSVNVDFNEFVYHNEKYVRGTSTIPGKTNLQIQLDETRQNRTQNFVRESDICSIYFDEDLFSKNINTNSGGRAVMTVENKKKQKYMSNDLGRRFVGKFSPETITIDYGEDISFYVGNNLTYIFDQTDSSNDGYPLSFGISGGTSFVNSIIKTDSYDAGVSQQILVDYYLNGSKVTYDQYHIGSLEEVASRYVEINYKSDFEIQNFSQQDIYYGTLKDGNDIGGRIKIMYH